MKLTSTSFTDRTRRSPGDFAFCTPDPAHHVCLGSNKNPQLAWSDVPVGAKSFAIICHDPDVPSKGDDVNQEGRSVPAELPRVDFFHWVLVDLPASVCAKSDRANSPTTSRRAENPARRHAARRAPGYQRLHRLVRR